MRLAIALPALAGLALLSELSVGLTDEQNPAEACIARERATLMTRWIAPLDERSATQAARDRCHDLVVERQRQRSEAWKKHEAECERRFGSYAQQPGWEAFQAWEKTFVIERYERMAAGQKPVPPPKMYEDYRACKAEAF